MKKTIGFTWRMLGALAWLGAAGLGHAEERVDHFPGPKSDQWLISEPPVNSPVYPGTAIEKPKVYGQILIQPGDTVYVGAGGCVQTGGSGKTWKRYVDPQGPNSDRLYHGRIGLPGLGPMRILDFINQYQGKYVSNYEGRLELNYEDDSPEDNGYYSHDDGTAGQCANVGGAWVNVFVAHP